MAETIKTITNASDKCCKKVTKQHLLDHLDLIREQVDQLPDEDDNSVVDCCDGDECVQSSMGVTCTALCAAQQSVQHTLMMVKAAGSEE
jgi:hypothetical protein